MKRGKHGGGSASNHPRPCAALKRVTQMAKPRTQNPQTHRGRVPQASKALYQWTTAEQQRLIFFRPHGSSWVQLHSKSLWHFTSTWNSYPTPYRNNSDRCAVPPCHRCHRCSGASRPQEQRVDVADTSAQDPRRTTHRHTRSTQPQLGG